jgi:hypothetical protein
VKKTKKPKRVPFGEALEAQILEALEQDHYNHPTPPEKHKSNKTISNPSISESKEKKDTQPIEQVNNRASEQSTEQVNNRASEQLPEQLPGQLLGQQSN